MPHLLQEEIRTQETPTPTPTPKDNAAVEGEKDLPDEGAPENLLKWASDRFNGAIDNLCEVLLNTDTPPKLRILPMATLTGSGLGLATWRLNARHDTARKLGWSCPRQILQLAGHQQLLLP